MSLDDFIVDPFPDVPNRFKVRLLNTEIGGVTGLMPRQVSTAFSNSWQPAISDLFRSFNTGFKAAQEFWNEQGRVDYTLNFKELTNQVWTGSGPMSMTLQLKYLSRLSGAYDEVVCPIKRILQLCGPSVAEQLKKELVRGKTVTATMLKPPQPFILEIGYVMAWREALPGNISITFDSISDDDGSPTMAEVQISLTMDKAYVVDDPDVTIQPGKWQTVGP